MSERAFRLAFVFGVICALIGAGASIWGYVNRPEAFYTAWLSAFYYWLSMPLGALALLMIHDLTGGKWEVVARPPLEAVAATMPLFILAFLPVIAGLDGLYSWIRPELVGEIKNRWYLNPIFFGIRAGAYCVIWNFFTFTQLWFPRRGGDAPPWAQWVSGIGLVLLGFSASFAAMDWLMSIEPDWFSSVYGMVLCSGQFVVSLSLVLLAITLLAPSDGDRTAFGNHLANLATILLAVDIFWAYTSYSQWLIIWEENLRIEIPWYIERLSTGWKALLYAIAATHFFIPFFALVWTPAKRSRVVVGVVAGLLMIANLLQVWWLVLPAFHRTGFTWLCPVVALGLGGLWFCLFLWRLQHGAILPFGAARSAERAAA